MRKILEQPVELNAEQTRFFDAMHEEYGPPIYNLLSLEVSNPEDAEDIQQEVFVTLAKNIKKIMTFKYPGKWLKKVALNRLKQYYRSRTRKRRAEIPLEELDMEPATYDNGFETAMEEIPSVLNHEEKTMLGLHMDGFTEKEIAEQLSINYGSCRVRFSRMRAKLRNWWDSR